MRASRPTRRWLQLALLALAGCSTTAIPLAGLGAAEPSDDHDNGHVVATVGFGNFSYETSPPSPPAINAETSARMFGLDFEAGGRNFGGGLRLETTLTGDDLDIAPDGFTGVNSKAVALDLFPHFTARVTADRFRLPIRVGPDIGALHIRTNVGGVDFVYVTVGGRLEIEPEFDIVRNEDVALSLFAGGSIGAGAAVIVVESAALDETFNSTATRYGLQAGLRVNASNFTGSLGWVSRLTSVDQSDVKGGFFAEEAAFGFQGFMLQLGFRW